jgi:RimJ/RimL family protein N-acetyltransferase
VNGKATSDATQRDPGRPGVPVTGFPRLSTARLVLRAFAADDAADVQRLAGDPAVAEHTALPHPYRDGIAEAWIAGREGACERGEETSFAIERAHDRALIGAIGLAFEPRNAVAKLGYWLGRPYWGRGYASEAAAAVVAHGFEDLALERIWAPRFRANESSARVLEKVGLAHEGSRREFLAERGRVECMEHHGCLRWEYFARVARCGYAGVPAAERRGAAT